MRITFFHSSKPRERLLADAFREGLKNLGGQDTVDFVELTGEAMVADAEVAVMVGVKSRQIFQANWRAGVHVLMIDKGYTRHAAKSPVKLWEYWRVALDAHHPTGYLMDTQRPPDRLMRLGLTFAPDCASTRLGRDGTILIAGSSAKYHEFYGLKEPTRWTEKLLKAITAVSSRRIVYRPKPSWGDAEPIVGTDYSGNDHTLEQELAQARVMITHGSNACFEAQLAGVPTIILGDGVAKPISPWSIEDLEVSTVATLDERRRWAANLAYCQWTMAEFASGEAWQHIRPGIFGPTRRPAGAIDG